MSESPSVPPLSKNFGSLGTKSVWRGDGGDWSRLQHLMRVLGHDGKRLEAWKSWRNSEGAIRDAIHAVLRDHVRVYNGNPMANSLLMFYPGPE